MSQGTCIIDHGRERWRRPRLRPRYRLFEHCSVVLKNGHPAFYWTSRESAVSKTQPFRQVTSLVSDCCRLCYSFARIHGHRTGKQHHDVSLLLLIFLEVHLACDKPAPTSPFL